MVAKITTPQTVLKALNYNEKKVAKGSAECIHAQNFLNDVSKLNFQHKLDRFKSLIALNSRAKTNTLHVSLNFHPSEKFSKEKLCEIAAIYMKKIGFEEQPFLVYQHHDAAHPHLHIVTTSIQENGKRIDTFNIGRIQSEKARKEIEKTYGMVKASNRKKQPCEDITPLSVQRLKYGLSETKRSISNVLNAVISQYKFTSLAELNAILKLYNVIADRSSEESRTYKHQGLHYRLLDEKGNKIGVPIKASSIYFKPTLKYLEQAFNQNEGLRLPFKPRLKTAIDWVFRREPTSLPEFISELKKENVTAVIRENEKGFMYGITFIDHRSKVVFNGSDLGKNYSIKAITERVANTSTEQQKSPESLLTKKENKTAQLLEQKEYPNKKKEINQPHDQKQGDNYSIKESLWDLLMNKEKNEQRIPFDLIRKKKKRPKPNL